MPYDSRTYQILIASPSDVEEEREIAVRVIQEWNDPYSYSKIFADSLPEPVEIKATLEAIVRERKIRLEALIAEMDTGLAKALKEYTEAQHRKEQDIDFLQAPICICVMSCNDLLEWFDSIWRV